MILLLPANYEWLTEALESLLWRAVSMADAPKDQSLLILSGLKLVVLARGSGSEPVQCSVGEASELEVSGCECLASWQWPDVGAAVYGVSLPDHCVFCHHREGRRVLGMAVLCNLLHDRISASFHMTIVMLTYKNTSTNSITLYQT